LLSHSRERGRAESSDRDRPMPGAAHAMQSGPPHGRLRRNRDLEFLAVCQAGGPHRPTSATRCSQVSDDA
jgi:hypothetical protein